MRVQAVFLDLDATLLDYPEAAWDATVHAVCADLEQTGADGLDAGRLFGEYTRISMKRFRAAEVSGTPYLDGHAIWREDWRQALAECGCDDPALADAAVVAYEADRGERYELYDDVLPALAELRERVAALALITNGPGSTQRHKVEVTGLTRLLDAVLISGEFGAAKPDPSIFAAAAGAAGVPLEAAWHVGDSLISDIAGARNARLGAGVWLNRTGAVHPGETVAPHPDYEIASLAELPALLR